MFLFTAAINCDTPIVKGFQLELSKYTAAPSLSHAPVHLKEAYINLR